MAYELLSQSRNLGPYLNTLCVQNLDVFLLSKNYEKIIWFEKLKKITDLGAGTKWVFAFFEAPKCPFSKCGSFSSLYLLL